MLASVKRYVSMLSNDRLLRCVSISWLKFSVSSGALVLEFNDGDLYTLLIRNFFLLIVASMVRDSKIFSSNGDRLSSILKLMLFFI
jgi:hypothetical protein